MSRGVGTPPGRPRPIARDKDSQRRPIPGQRLRSPSPKRSSRTNQRHAHPQSSFPYDVTGQRFTSPTPDQESQEKENPETSRLSRVWSPDTPCPVAPTETLETLIPGSAPGINLGKKAVRDISHPGKGRPAPTTGRDCRMHFEAPLQS